MYTLARYTLYFVIYSLLGAIAETTFRLITEQHLYGVHGFLHIPILPIYGFGALIILFIAQKIRNPIGLFIVGTIAATVLEFVTSWLIEIIFHERIWDYTDKVFDAWGRVSLETSLIFGLGGLVVVYVIHPLIAKYVKRVPKRATIMIALAIGVVLIVNVISSVIERLA